MLFQNCCNQSRNDAISDDRLYCKTDVISNSREMMQGTESEKFIRLITWDDFSTASVELASFKDCRKTGCTMHNQGYAGIQLSNNMWPALFSAKERFRYV
jgi:hypothetical protein